MAEMRMTSGSNGLCARGYPKPTLPAKTNRMPKTVTGQGRFIREGGILRANGTGVHRRWMIQVFEGQVFRQSGGRGGLGPTRDAFFSPEEGGPPPAGGIGG